jgi:regulation of enolase protein 1 (concanavalin A-like superfamily)
LEISLDDQPKGRPRDFNTEEHGMVLVLRRFLALDPFQGHWALDWKPIRFDPSHVSLTKNPGCLTITTQIGSIHGKEKERGEPSAKNLFVLENPLAKDADFAITTCISGFTPQMAFQQAGLICYHDDDNYAKWVYMLDYSNGAGQAFSFLRETNAESTFEHQPAPSDFQRLWLRLTRRGRFYEYSASTDGKTFTTYGKQPWDGIPSRVGILAKNGGRPGVPEVDVCFHFFELRSPPAPENE